MLLVELSKHREGEGGWGHGMHVCISALFAASLRQELALIPYSVFRFRVLHSGIPWNVLARRMPYPHVLCCALLCSRTTKTYPSIYSRKLYKTKQPVRMLVNTR